MSPEEVRRRKKIAESLRRFHFRRRMRQLAYWQRRHKFAKSFGGYVDFRGIFGRSA